ncbi:diguanylate cyclase (GGDEF)-like protein/PAS domain S-box-containing protein [Cupriavidus metallidurans]|jgi:diguanylate cyclase (GGDEF)-like protein/PAS domain S-box-containing protein|uniref:GGDEF domain-containing protein n=1 Tax=Cupriavidus metallidurans TaxID=119219 RepID=UPI00068FC124|nr:GGDEF domain-containing protein [Cupriavidus metallidurans]KWW39420.1 putative diguanylate cyclase YdaM [Cupriavidus metallidurans]MDE4920635.1 GGDEF domain-containing protein [Cupriavidus metallidurans]
MYTRRNTLLSEGVRRVVEPGSWLRYAVPVFALFVIASVLLNAFQSWQDWDSARDEQARQLEIFASQVADLYQLEDSVAGMLENAVSNLLDRTALSDNGLKAAAERHSPMLGSAQVVVVDGSNRILGASSEVARTWMPGLFQKLEHRHASQSERLSWLWTSPGGDSVEVVASAYRGQNRASAATIILFLPLRPRKLERLPMQRNALIYVRNGRGESVDRLPHDPRMPVHQVVDLSRYRIPTSIPSAFYLYFPWDGITRLAVTKKVLMATRNESWSVTVGTDRAVYLVGWRRSLYVNVANSCLLILFLLMGVALLRREARLSAGLSASAEHGIALQAAMDNLPAPIYIKDTSGLFRGCNAALAAYTGHEPRDIIGQRTSLDLWPGDMANGYMRADAELIATGGTQIFETKMPHVDGTVRDVCLYKALYRDADGQVLGIVGAMMDITERKALETVLRKVAEEDSLTGLANRRHFMEVGNKEYTRARRYDGPLSVLMLDLDCFKQINDTWGHPKGDSVLQAFARTLKQMLRETDMPGRLGGEEFAVILPSINAAEACIVAERIRSAVLEQQVQSEKGESIRFTVSIGVAEMDAKNDSLEQLLKHADQALYRAKESGRNRVKMATASMADAT